MIQHTTRPHEENKYIAPLQKLQTLFFFFSILGWCLTKKNWSGQIINCLLDTWYGRVQYIVSWDEGGVILIILPLSTFRSTTTVTLIICHSSFFKISSSQLIMIKNTINPNAGELRNCTCTPAKLLRYIRIQVQILESVSVFPYHNIRQ